MKLYYIPLTRATRPRWLLEEMELPYQLVRITSESSTQAELQKLHPHGKVPVFVDEEVTIFESTAICSYLTDRYPDRQFAPSLQSPARAYYYQWLFYSQVTLEPPIEKYIFQVAPHLPEQVVPHSDRSTVPKQEAFQWFLQVCDPLNEVLKDRDYLVDNRFSTVDVVVGGVLYWAYKLGLMNKEMPVKNYLMQLIERPAFQKAHDDINIYRTAE